MKRLSIALVFFFLLPLTVAAATITIASHTFSLSTTYPGSTCTLRIYSSITFTAADGTTVMAGTPSTGAFFKSVPCTISSGIITISSFTIPSTTDALDNGTAKYSAVLFDSNGVKRDVFLSEFVLPTSMGTSVTWTQIRVNQSGTQPSPDTSVYTKAETDAKIALAIGNLNRANVGILGRIETASVPKDPLHHKAVLIQDIPILVNQFATGGLGTLASPWTGWDTAITWAAKTAYYFPAGYYSYSTSPNFALADIQLTGAGPQKTFLKFTGSGIAMKLDKPTGGGVTGPIISDLSITGSASCTTGIYLRAVHHISIRNVEVRNLTGAALETHWSVLGVLDNFRVSANEGAFTTTPRNGIIFDQRGDGEQTTTWSVISPIIEHVGGDGIVGTSCSNMTFTSGTSEGNAGIGLVFQNNSTDNVVISMDNEENRGDDFLDNGKNNMFINCLAAKAGPGTGMFRAGASVSTHIIGGQFNSIRLEATASMPIVHNVRFNFEGRGTFVNSAMSSDLIAVRDVGNSSWAIRPNNLLVYDEGGNEHIGSHIVCNSVALSGGTKTVPFLGGAVFSNAAFTVLATDATAANPVKASISGTSLVLTGTGSDVIYYCAIGR